MTSISSPSLPWSRVIGGGQLARWTPVRRVMLQTGLVAFASAVIGVLAAASGSWEIPAALLAGGAFAALGMLRPALFLATFLLIRPVLAAVSDGQLVHGVASGNADGLVALLLIGIAVVALVGTRNVYFPPITVWFSVVFAISVVAAFYAFSTLGGAHIGTSPISELGRLGAELATYLLAANLVTSAARARQAFTLVALSAVVPALIGVIQLINGPPFVPSLGVARIESTFGGGPNEFAAYLAVCALIMIGRPQLMPRWIRLPSLTLVLIALVGTYSREGWGMFLVGIVLLGWRRRRGMVLGIAALTAAVVILVPAVQSRVLPANRPVTPSTATVQAAPTYGSFTWRVDTWRILLGKWLQRPVFGYGLRSTQYVNPRRTVLGGDASTGFAAHNTFVNILVEGGIVLLIAYLFLIRAILGTCVRLSRERWPLSALASLLLILWIVVLFGGITSDDTLGETTLMYAMFALTGALEGTRRFARRGKTLPSQPLIAD